MLNDQAYYKCLLASSADFASNKNTSISKLKNRGDEYSANLDSLTELSTHVDMRDFRRPLSWDVQVTNGKDLIIRLER